MTDNVYLGIDLYISEVTDDVKINYKNDFVLAKYINNLAQAIRIRLSTVPGELSLHPTYGCGLKLLVGSNSNSLLLSEVKQVVREALLQEPRIEEIQEITPAFRANTNNQIIDISIKVTAIKDNASLNMIYPFILEEGA